MRVSGSAGKGTGAPDLRGVRDPDTQGGGEQGSCPHPGFGTPEMAPSKIMH